MLRREKEEERIEKIIQGLLKLKENRRCINCNSLGPQYVCTNFWTFVCTKCSGVHREFTHRVKSVSMAKFNAEEVSSLQAGGNEQARKIYFKTWDPRCNSLPDGSNLQRLRDFIKHVYVEKKFVDEKSLEKLTMVKTDLKDNSCEKCSYDTYGRRQSLGRSISEGGYGPRNFSCLLFEIGPQYKEKESPGGIQSRPTADFETVDRYDNDGYRNGRHHERLQVSNTVQRGESLPPSPCKMREVSLPEVRSIKEILGDSVPRLKIGKGTKENKETPDSTFSEKTSVSNTPGSVDGEQKTEKSINLIDFDADGDAASEHSGASVSSYTQETASSTDAENSSLPLTQQSALEKASLKPHNMNSVESLLFELAGPVDVPSMVDTSSATHAASFNDAQATEAASDKGNVMALPSKSGDSLAYFSNGQHLLDTPQQPPSASPAVDGSFTAKQSSLSVEASSDQITNSKQALKTQAATFNAFSEQSSEVAPKQAQETNSVHASKPASRKELPKDILAALYSSHPAPIPSGQFCPAHGIGTTTGTENGMGMLYNPSALPVHCHSYTSKPMNPSDLDADTSQAQNAKFPSMAALQGALPLVSAQMGSQPQSSLYAFALNPQQSPSHEKVTTPGSYVGQSRPNDMQTSRDA